MCPGCRESCGNQVVLKAVHCQRCHAGRGLWSSDAEADLFCSAAVKCCTAGMTSAWRMTDMTSPWLHSWHNVCRAATLHRALVKLRQKVMQLSCKLDLTHVLSDASLVHCTKAMPQHAFEVPFVLSLPISRAPPPVLWLPCLPAALIVCSIHQCEPALPLHGVSFPLAFVPVLVAEGVLSPSRALVLTPLPSVHGTILINTCALPVNMSCDSSGVT